MRRAVRVQGARRAGAPSLLVLGSRLRRIQHHAEGAVADRDLVQGESEKAGATPGCCGSRGGTACGDRLQPRHECLGDEPGRSQWKPWTSQLTKKRKGCPKISLRWKRPRSLFMSMCIAESRRWINRPHATSWRRRSATSRHSTHMKGAWSGCEPAARSSQPEASYSMAAESRHSPIPPRPPLASQPPPNIYVR